MGDIYYMPVTFDDGSGVKNRYVVKIAYSGLLVAILDNITSQYVKKSKAVKAQYYPIQEWRAAGLKKQSYIDILSAKEVSVNSLIHEKYVGTLSKSDLIRLAKFIDTYPERIQATY